MGQITATPEQLYWNRGRARPAGGWVFAPRVCSWCFRSSPSSRPSRSMRSDKPSTKARNFRRRSSPPASSVSTTSGVWSEAPTSPMPSASPRPSRCSRCRSSCVMSLLIALLLNERFIGNTVLRAGMLLPWALPASITGIVWKFMFLDSWGAAQCHALRDRRDRLVHRVVDVPATRHDGGPHRLRLGANASRDRSAPRRRAGRSRGALRCGRAGRCGVVEPVSGRSRCRASVPCWSSSSSMSS